MLTDYFHRDYLSIVADVVGTDGSKVVRTNLLPFCTLNIDAARPSSKPRFHMALIAAIQLIFYRLLYPTTI
jgi:hypothetical protein